MRGLRDRWRCGDVRATVRSNAGAHENHRRTAAGAVQRWALRGWWGEAARIEFEQQVQQGDQAFAVGVQEAVIAGAAETARQHVLRDQAEEVGTGQGASLPASGSGLAIVKRDVGFVAGQDVQPIVQADRWSA